MSTASISLETLQFLLQHMEANRRFEISKRCPALRAVEKSVPLKIDKLMLTKSSVTVNDTSYSLGIIRKYLVGEAPGRVKLDNWLGGVKHEVDRYGIEDMSDAATAAPGDVEIRRRGRGPPRDLDDDIKMGMLENRIQNNEAQLANFPEWRRNRNRGAIEEMESRIESYRAKLLAYQNRRDNIPPNYEHFLQLTMTRICDKKEQITTERFNHNKKYSEALRKLTEVLFGGRSCPILAKKMVFICRQGIIRLPANLKLHIEHLTISGDLETTLEAMSPIIHESSYPLKNFGIHASSVADVNHPVVQTAGKLKISVLSENILHILTAVTNRKVHFDTEMPEEIFRELIRIWIGLERSVGTERVIDFCYEPEFSDEFEDILKGFNGVIIDEKNVIIPMSDTTQLNISYGPFPEFAPHSKWAVKLVNEAVEN